MSRGVFFTHRAARLALAAVTVSGGLALSAATLAVSAAPAGAAGCGTPVITSAASATATAGSTFGFTVTTACSPVTPVIKAVGLPMGLHLMNNLNGTATISGIPSMADAGPKVATLSAISKGFPIATQSFTVTVDNVPVFKSRNTYTDATGGAFSFEVRTIHGYPAPTMAVSGQPAGVTLTDNHDGTAVLSDPGPISNGGVYTFTISANAVTQSFKLVLRQTPAITSLAGDGVMSGEAMTPFTVTTTGFPAPAFMASGLPLGVKFTNNHNGTATISGTPQTPGNYTISITATNGAGSSTQTFGIKVAGPKQGVVAMAATPDGAGYWMVDDKGNVVAFGDAGFYGSTAGLSISSPIVDIAPTADGHGYWLVTAAGGIFSFGDAEFYGSTGGISIPSPIVGITASADGHGYWLVDMVGGIYSFGDAAYYGSPAPYGVSLNSVLPIVRTPDGKGYWMTDSNGYLIAWGDAGYYGDTVGDTLPSPIVGLAATADGGGYWLVTAAGGIFSFGDAAFYGSTGSLGISDIAGIVPSHDGHGYWLFTDSGGIYSFGDAAYYGSM